jgi:hypothetical protein
MKLAIPEKLHIPAAIFGGCGLVAVGLAYGLSDDTGRAPIVAAVGVLWGVAQAFLPALLSGGKAEE